MYDGQTVKQYQRFTSGTAILLWKQWDSCRDEGGKEIKRKKEIWQTTYIGFPSRQGVYLNFFPLKLFRHSKLNMHEGTVKIILLVCLLFLGTLQSIGF